MKWGGKEVHVRFGTAVGKKKKKVHSTCRVEKLFDVSVGRWGLQAAEQLFIIFCASFSCIVMDISVCSMDCIMYFHVNDSP